jgi:predicted ATPase/transcriptional regulator with XRE-family HTH domain
MVAGSAGSTSFGSLLRELRLAAGLTHEQLAERAGLSVDAISALENGRRQRPRSDTVAMLAGGMGLSPADGERLAAAARAGGRPRVPPPAGPPAPAARPRLRIPTDLRPPATALVGRDDLLARVCELLRTPDVRLLTLTGPPGVGKTRVALEAARQLVDDFPDGVFAVALASLDDAGQVPTAIAMALDVLPQRNRELLETLADHCRGRALLLVADNLEHLAGAAGTLTQLLRECPALRLLVTSRASLNVRDEHRLGVPPLELPDPRRPDWPAPAASGDAPALRLFVQRATAAVPDFTLTAANAAAVGEICRQLDGLPLALELAAPWTRLLEPAALLAHLEHRLDLLVDGARDLPERQRGLRQTLAWSYGLLDADERRLLRWLSVFSGGMELEAVQVVCAGELPPGRLLVLLSRLVDKNLVRRQDEGGEPRLRMLETIREYGQTILGGDEAEAARRAHAEHYARLAERASGGLHGPEQATWLDRLGREHDNLRAALQWAGEQDETRLGLRVAEGLTRYWECTNRQEEGRIWLDRFLGSDAPVEPELRARALAVSGYLAGEIGDHARAIVCEEAATALARALDDPRTTALVWTYVSEIASWRDEPERVLRFSSDALSLWRTLENPWGIASTSGNLGVAVSWAGEDYDRALPLLEESLDAWRRIGHRRSVALALSNLGGTAVLAGSLERARACLEEALVRCDEIQDGVIRAVVLNQLGGLARAEGDAPGAVLAHADSLRSWLRWEHVWGAAASLEGIAAVASECGLAEDAALLCSTAAALREAADAPMRPQQRSRHERTVGEVRRALSAERFQQAWDAGRTMTLGTAADRAFEVVRTIAAAAERS